jgi:hypothetical protein
MTMSLARVTPLLPLAACAVSANDITGPSSSASSYVARAVPGVVTKSILTVGDSVNAKPDGTPYRFVGIPDGLGAFDNGNGTFTVLVNHELRAGTGVVRAQLRRSPMRLDPGSAAARRSATPPGELAS